MDTRIRRASMWLGSVILGIALIPGLANATLLAPGASLSPVPFSNRFGTEIANTGVQPYTMVVGSMIVGTGTVQEIVFRDDSANPLGGLTFAYQVHVTTGDVARLTGFDYTGFQTDVAQAFPGTSPPFAVGIVQPASATRTSSAVVGFNFLPAIPGGDDIASTSYVLLIRTDAANFKAGTIGVVDGGGATIAGYAPAVPEPASGLLLGLGAAGMIRFGRKRRNVTG